MLKLNYNIYEDEAYTSLKQERHRRQFMKEAQKELLEQWRIKYLKKHFVKQALSDYPIYNAFLKPKKSKAGPLYKTGNLRKRLLRKANAKVRGTYKSASMKIRYGRPKRPTQKEMRRKAFIIMQKEVINFKSALSQAYKENVYSAKNKAMFQTLVPEVNRFEVEALAQHMANEFTKSFQPKGRKKLIRKI